MERINYTSLKFVELFDNLNPKNSGIIFSIFLHLILLLSAVGLPNFFGPKEVFVPNIIPIEILNVSETTNIEKVETKNDLNADTNVKQKKFNSSDNIEVQKQFEITENIKNVEDNNQPTIEIKQKEILQIEEKKNNKIKQNNNFEIKNKVETIKTDKIKPKLKPQAEKNKSNTLTTSDVIIQPKSKKENINSKEETITKPKIKPKEDFSIATMLKDLRNEKSNISEEVESIEDDIKQVGENKQNENMILSISEIDLLRQQLSACWSAPAGAVINIGDKVIISAKIRQNMTVLENSIRIVDTNISKSNPFYGPITESAMRTLLNPECTPLKLPKDKYSLWKSLTITFDYSIMKGY